MKPLPVVGDYGSYTFISVQHGVLWTSFFFHFLMRGEEETRKKRGGWYTKAVPRLFLSFLRIFSSFFFTKNHSSMFILLYKGWAFESLSGERIVE